jgi:hypothetical protein
MLSYLCISAGYHVMLYNCILCQLPDQIHDPGMTSHDPRPGLFLTVTSTWTAIPSSFPSLHMMVIDPSCVLRVDAILTVTPVTRAWFLMLPALAFPTTFIINAPFGRFASQKDGLFTVDGVLFLGSCTYQHLTHLKQASSLGLSWK